MEDAVAPEKKRPEARRSLAGVLGSNDTARLATRINSPSTIGGLADLQAIVLADAYPTFLILPKSESAGVLRQNQCADEKPTALVALVESAWGLRHVEAVAEATPRLRAIIFGAAGMASDLGCERGGGLLHAARCHIAIACAAGGIAAIDPPSFNLNDLEAMAAEADRACKLGFAGKAAIHRSQIAPIDASFRPDAKALDRARRIVELAKKGVGVDD
ncbi:HpcH/HpaI aldolase/citrate lyase family protein [Sphingobium sp. SCG-1]|uniref:HpcH/HpaI aldolase/citrate lyase family protein n=1 Tax=Sphingobium sp. SCG-1 TaxID=2072936 RepID=UPI001CB93B3B|nr:aldolase/citrate lyase family protein [Sphingobium sp. SCG-1]